MLVFPLILRHYRTSRRWIADKNLRHLGGCAIFCGRILFQNMKKVCVTNYPVQLTVSEDTRMSSPVADPTISRRSSIIPEEILWKPNDVHKWRLHLPIPSLRFAGAHTTTIALLSTSSSQQITSCVWSALMSCKMKGMFSIFLPIPTQHWIHDRIKRFHRSLLFFLPPITATSTRIWYIWKACRGHLNIS